MRARSFLVYLIPGTLFTLGSLVFTGCMHREMRDESSLSEVTSVAPANSFSLTGTRAINNYWWKEFNDPQLDALMEKAFRDNLSVAQSWSRLDQSRALLRAAGGSRLPSLSFTASNTAQWTNDSEGSGTDQSSYGTTTLQSSYEVDFWGRVNSARDAAYFDTIASEQDLQTAALSVASQIANTWFSLVEAQSERRLLQEQFENANKRLEMLENRFERGQSKQTDVLQQRQIVESRNGLLIRNQSDIDVLTHSLTVLLGEDLSYASQINIPNAFAETLPAFPALGIPLEVVSERPDLKSAWAGVNAADADVAASIANRFPKITLTGTMTSVLEGPADLFNEWVKTFVASLNTTLFDGGQKSADTERKQALLASAFLAYQQSFLEAIAEVEDAISQERQQLLYLDSLKKQVELAGQVLEQNTNRFNRGNVNYLQVITAQDNLLSLKRSLLTAQQNQLQYRINLYKAVGGPIELPESEAYENTRELRL